jgi:AhpD family alkylhydroperoxidase
MARIDLPPGEGPEVARALALRPKLGHAVGVLDRAVWESALDWRLHELVRMRVAQINGCAVCLAWRTPEAVEAGATEELLAHVHEAKGRDGYTEAELVALDYAGRYCTDPASIDDGLIGRLGEYFDSGQLVELTLVIGKYLALGRFMQVLGLDQSCTLGFDDQGALTAR